MYLRSILATDLQRSEFLHQPLDALQTTQDFLGRRAIRQTNFSAQIKPLYDLLHVHAGEVFVKSFGDGGADQFFADVVRALHFAFVFEFQLAGDSGHGCIHIADARHRGFFFIAQSAPLSIGNHIFHAADGQTLAHARTFVNALVFAGDEGNPLDHFLYILRQVQAISVSLSPGLLRRNGNSFFHRGRIVGTNLRADAVLQRRNDLAARRVIFRIRAEHQGNIQRQADGITLNLYVAFLHDVEQAYLDLARQIRQFVDGEDAAVGPWQQSVMYCQLAAQFMSAPRRFNRIDVADQVSNRDVRSRQFLNVPLFRCQIGDRCRIAALLHKFAAALADRRIRIVVNLAAGKVRHLLVQQRG